MNTIKPLSPIKPAGSPTSDTDTRQQSYHHVRPGHTFTATVLGTIGKNRFYLDINEQKILAQCDTDRLKPGTQLKLQVLTTTPLVELKILSDVPQSIFGRTVTLLGKNLDTLGFLQSFNPPPSSWLDTVTTSSQDGLKNLDDLQAYSIGNKDGGTVLKQLIDRLGLSLEGLLTKKNSNSGADTLNAALLEMAALLKNAERIAEKTNRLLGTLELYELARLNLKSEHLHLYSLPLPFLDQGYLLVEEDLVHGKSEKTDNTLLFSLHLNLAPLGNVEIHFSQVNQGVSIRFACESEEKKQFISEHQDVLRNILRSKSLLDLSFSDTAGDPATELLRQLVPENESMLDTKV